MEEIKNKILEEGNELFFSIDLEECDNTYLSFIIILDENKVSPITIRKLITNSLPSEGYEYRTKVKNTLPDNITEWLLQIFKD